MKRALVLICLASALLGACSAAHSSYAAKGTVTGRLVIDGGPSGVPPNRPVQGVVRFIGGHQPPVTVSTNAAGVFWVQLPPGRYDVSDRSPHILEESGGTSRQEWSASVPVTITEHHTTAITLTWFVP